MEEMLKWKLHELMNGGVYFEETPNEGDTYTYTHEDVDYKFVFVEDHWELEEE
tara:strand:+ start:63 stop:221 length:159 start_codon:yes stop_codon:yes gene_type:complete